MPLAKNAPGKGICGKLLMPIPEFCDRENTVVYLETNRKSNVSLYEHFSFDRAKKELMSQKLCYELCYGEKSKQSHCQMIIDEKSINLNFNGKIRAFVIGLS